MSPRLGIPVVDPFLRRAGRFGIDQHVVAWREIALMVVAGGATYGAVMGLYGGSALQAAYSALKVPFLLGTATLLCLPNFVVLNAVLGLRDDFAAALRGIISSQGTVAITLAALAPITLSFYASTADYGLAKLFNGLVFGMASLAGQWTLALHYRPLIAGEPRHRIGLAAWLLLYAFVAIQLAWILRPFVGAPGLPAQFLRPNAWGNAYVEVAFTVWQALMR